MKLIRLLNRFFAWLLTYLERRELVTAAETMAVQIANPGALHARRRNYSGNAHDRRKARRARARQLQGEL